MQEVFDYEEAPLPPAFPVTFFLPARVGLPAAGARRPGFDLSLRLAIVGANLATALLLINPLFVSALVAGLDRFRSVARRARP